MKLTGLSDHYKIISTTMKSGSFKGPPKKKKNTDVIKTFDIANFNSTLKDNLEKVNNNS